jgi:hypothetical protein
MKILNFPSLAGTKLFVLIGMQQLEIALEEGFKGIDVYAIDCFLRLGMCLHRPKGKLGCEDINQEKGQQ